MRPRAYTAAQDRFEGYRQALAGAGLVGIRRPGRRGGVRRAERARRHGRSFLERAAFDAVFVASDVVALGAIGALRGAGRRVPEAVSVVGFDDIPLAAFFDPPLTTVRLPAFELGQAVGRALLERIAQPTIPTRTLLPTELIVRGSTAPPPNA